MSKITPPSFAVDHRTMNAGLYLRESHLTYRVWDLRFVAPRLQEYLSPKALHSIEHLFAFKLRPHLKSQYISVFPFGCQTGFGLITGPFVSKRKLKRILREVIWEFNREFSDSTSVESNSILPGFTELECGQPLLKSVTSAHRWLNIFLYEVL